MAERIQQIREKITTYIKASSKRAKVFMIVGAVLFVLLIAFFILNMTKVEYVVFNRGLSPEESGEITAKLDELGISWKVEQNASTILIAKSQIDEARMKLALSGFSGPKTLTYLDISDKMSFTMSAETKNKLFLQAQQSSIENSLMSIEDIEKAKVIINVKESSTFLNLEEDVSSASVIISLKSGKTLSGDQIQGIVSFVATAVKGLEEENITLIDQNGVRLNRVSGSEGEYSSGSQDELKVGIEKRLDASLTEFLEQIYGYGRVRVKTGVKLFFDSEVTESEIFKTPIEGAQEGLLRSVNELKENVVGGAQVGGAPGTDSNTTETPQFPTTSSNSDSGYSKSQQILNYELNRVASRLEKAKGQILDISIAIIIDKKSLKDETLTDADSKKIVELVKAAAGFEETKNVQVIAQDFFKENEVPLETPQNTILGLPLWLFGVMIAVILIVIIAAILLLRRRKKETEVAVEEIEMEQQELEEIQADFDDKSSPKYQIEKFIDSRPEIVAQLLRSWMNDNE